MVRVVVPGLAAPLDVQITTPRRAGAIQAKPTIGATIITAAAVQAAQETGTMYTRQVGVYPFGGTANAYNLTEYEGWLGKTVQRLLAYTKFDGSWQDMLDGIDTAAGIYAGTNLPIMWSLGICDTLENVAAGVSHTELTAIANKLKTTYPTGPILIRPMWEMNGDWYSWSAYGREATFISAWKRIVGYFRAVSSRFQFHWCANQTSYVEDSPGHYTPVNPATMYPGNPYVDRVGFDLYLSGDPEVDHADDAAAWDAKLNAPYALAWLKSFAHSHNKPIDIGEVGFGRECQAFTANWIAWAAANNASFNYFETVDAKGDWRLSTDQFPLAGAEFIAAYGVPKPPTGIWTYVPITDATLVDLYGVTQKIQTARKPWSLARHAETNSYRHEVRKGDVWSGDVGRTSEYNRSEISSNHKLTIGETVDYALQVKTSGPIDLGTIISQLHATEDAGDQPSHAEYFLRLDQTNRNRVYTSYVTSPDPNAPITEVKQYEALNWVAGQVYNFVVRIKPSGGAATGLLKVWRDGVLIVDQSNIRIGYPNTYGPYFKSGVYLMASTLAPGSQSVVVEVYNLEGPTTSDLTGRNTSPPAVPEITGDPPAPTLPANLGQSFPAYVPEAWKGQYPWNSSGGYSGIAMEAWPAPYSATPPGGSAIPGTDFPVNCQSARVSGSGFPRFEHREMNTNGTEAGWNLKTASHLQRTITKIIELPTRQADHKPGRLVFNQTHQKEGSNEPCRIMFDGSTPSSSGADKPPAQGANCVYVMVDLTSTREIRRFLLDQNGNQLRITDWSLPWETTQIIELGVLRVHALYNGVYYVSEAIDLNPYYADAASNPAYFKHGNYLQLGASTLTNPTPAEIGTGNSLIRHLQPAEVLHS